jgi:hypothetical protein
VAGSVRSVCVMAAGVGSTQLMKKAITVARAWVPDYMPQQIERDHWSVWP